MPELSFEEVAEILGLLQAVDGADMELQWGDLHLQVSRNGVAPGPGRTTAAGAPGASPPVPAPEPVAAPVPATGTVVAPSPAVPGAGTAGDGAADEGAVTVVRAPMVGIFYRSPKPGEPPYVEVGDTVAAGDVVAQIEVMKLFTELTAGIAGRVTGIAAEDAALVEFDQPLLRIEPA